MAQVTPRVVLGAPSSGVTYGIYTVPANQILYVEGVSVAIQGATTTNVLTVISQSNIGLLESYGAPSAKRDFTGPMVLLPGDLIEMVWTGTGTPSALIGDVFGYLL